MEINIGFDTPILGNLNSIMVLDNIMLTYKKNSACFHVLNLSVRARVCVEHTAT